MTTLTAKRLPRQPGPAGWNAILPDRAPNPVLEGDRVADVVVIGAGFAGLSTARRLAQLDPELDVVVLEAGQVAEGPAGRNSGFMVDLPHDLSSDDYSGAGPEEDKARIRHNRIAIGFARDLADETRMPQEVFDTSGKINAAATEAGDRHNRNFATYLMTLGEPSHLMDAAEMRDLTGGTFYRSGLRTPSAVIIQPAAYIRQLAATLGERVTLYEHSPVQSLSNTGADWRVVTPKGNVTAPKVILATNGHAESFGLFRRRLMHVFTYASMTKVLTADEIAAVGGAPRWGVTPSDPMGATVRRISGVGGDRIVVRARFTYDPSMQVSEARLARVGAMHDAKFAERFPMLSGVGMEYRWAGHLCLSWNGVPAFGEVEPGLISAVCQNGLGTVQGTLAGLAAAEVAAGQPGSAAAAFDGVDQPRKLPPEPLAWIGANAVMRWKEWRAGQE